MLQEPACATEINCFHLPRTSCVRGSLVLVSGYLPATQAWSLSRNLELVVA